MCMMLTLAENTGWGCKSSVSWRDPTFDLAIVTLILKSYLGYISETVRYRKLILGSNIG